MNSEQRKRQFRGWLLLVVIFFGFVYTAGVSSAGTSPIGRLSDFSGQVMVKNAGSWEKPFKGMGLYVGDRIVTQKGTAVVTFNNGKTYFVKRFSKIPAIEQMTMTSKSSQYPRKIKQIKGMMNIARVDGKFFVGNNNNNNNNRISHPATVTALR